MTKTGFSLGAIVVLIVLALGAWLGSSFRNLTGNTGANAYNTATVVRQVQTLAQLVTVKYVMEKVVVYEDVKWFPGGDNRVLMIAHGIVKAGVDLEKLKPEDIEFSEKRVRIHLPAAQIMDCYLDDRQTQVVERTTGILRTFDKDLEQTARKIAVEDVRRGARSAGILKDADERARHQLEKFFQQMGFEAEFVAQ